MTHAQSIRTLSSVLRLVAFVCVVLAPPSLRADPIFGSSGWSDPQITSPTLNYNSFPGELEVLTYNPSNHPDPRAPKRRPVRCDSFSGRARNRLHG